MIRAALHSIRCVFVALFALSIVSARPAMMLAHDVPAAQHGCGKSMASHRSQHQGHHCSDADHGSCCDDCLCACSIRSGIAQRVVAYVAAEARTHSVPSNPVQPVRARRSYALRLPPPIGPPLSTRS